MEKHRKQFKLNQSTIDKIEKLKHTKELENPGIKIYEKDIIIDAINLLYSSKFGKDVFEETINKLDTVIMNSMNQILRENLKPYADALNNIYSQGQISKEAMLLILRANNIVEPEKNGMLKRLLENQNYEDIMEEALYQKRERLEDNE